MTPEFDVIILGYGPVGAVLANMLGQDGLSVAVVDRMLDIFDKPRAINIDHEVMRILQSVGLADKIEQITCHHTGTDFRGLGGRLIKAFHPVQPPYLLGWAPNLMFIQPEFEPILRRGVERFSNVEILLGYDAVQLEQDEESASIQIRSAEGERTISAKYIVACDGASSWTRKVLGIPQDSLDFDEWWTVVDAWLKPGAEVPARTTQFCDPSGPTTYVVGPRGLRRWELKLLPHERPQDLEDRDTLRQRLRPFVDPDAIEIWRVATYRFHALVAARWRKSRVLLAGDSAHQMPPFMAQGLCSGIRDAGNLAWKLTAVLRDGIPDQLLDTYGQERKPHIRQLVQTTKELGLIIGELDPARAAERDAELARELEAGASVTVRQKLIPDLTEGMIALGEDGLPAPGAGTLSPQPWVVDQKGRRRRLDDVAGANFVLLTRGEAPRSWLSAEACRAWSRLQGRAIVLLPQGRIAPGPDALVEEGSLACDWMDQHHCDVVVIRPDKYVYGIAADAGSLNKHLLRLAEMVIGKPSSGPPGAGLNEARPVREFSAQNS